MQILMTISLKVYNCTCSPGKGKTWGELQQLTLNSLRSVSNLSLHQGHDISYIDTSVIVTILLTISISLLVLTLHHIVGLTRICRFSPRIQQFSSRLRRELLNSLRESSNSRRDENCFSPLTTRIAQFSVTLERMRELLFSDEQRRQ